MTCDSDGPRRPAGAPTVLAESRDATAAGLVNPATQCSSQALGHSVLGTASLRRLYGVFTCGVRAR